MKSNVNFITVRELSEKISISQYTLRKLAREGKLPAYRFTGKQYLFDFEEVVLEIKKYKA